MDLLIPFEYDYMITAMIVGSLVGGVCGFLSAFLMLKGWSLIGDALSHSIVPGVAGAYMLGLPFSIGAFFSGGLASSVMLFLNQRSKLKEDTIIGLIFSSFFGIYISNLGGRANYCFGKYPSNNSKRYNTAVANIYYFNSNSTS